VFRTPRKEAGLSSGDSLLGALKTRFCFRKNASKMGSRHPCIISCRKLLLSNFFICRTFRSPFLNGSLNRTLRNYSVYGDLIWIHTKNSKLFYMYNTYNTQTPYSIFFFFCSNMKQFPYLFEFLGAILRVHLINY